MRILTNKIEDSLLFRKEYEEYVLTIIKDDNVLFRKLVKEDSQKEKNRIVEEEIKKNIDPRSKTWLKTYFCEPYILCVENISGNKRSVVWKDEWGKPSKEKIINLFQNRKRVKKVSLLIIKGFGLEYSEVFASEREKI